eukprot:13518045-Heterocapsa_arctica.AAC.1
MSSSRAESALAAGELCKEVRRDLVHDVRRDLLHGVRRDLLDLVHGWCELEQVRLNDDGGVLRSTRSPVGVPHLVSDSGIMLSTTLLPPVI